MGTRNKLVDVKVKDVVAFIKAGHSIGETAAHYGVSTVSLYNKFGDSIKGLVKRGRKAGSTAAPKAKTKGKPTAKKAPKKAVAAKKGSKATPAKAKPSKAAKAAPKGATKKAAGKNAKVVEVAPDQFELA